MSNPASDEPSPDPAFDADDLARIVRTYGYSGRDVWLIVAQLLRHPPNLAAMADEIDAIAAGVDAMGPFEAELAAFEAGLADRLRASH
ncbi:hypothetical protein [Paraconexibacter algicola]|uniref:Uncharacterized protein n=1 Tax=Paraconexibacter algicola TaxID=2133960 RepID=A0A2T4UED0_9ACTN|nr:hypothetical protein [Paraconexibacter algicola]PTL56144.1 hypothetical protein C7Y72_14215 [Paraconexibacter algicola]